MAPLTSLLLSMAVRLAVLAYCLAVPGRALARWLGLQATSRIDATLIVIVLSLSSVSATVTVLLFAHAYSRPVLSVLLLCPAVVLALWRPKPGGVPLPAASTAAPRDYVERAILAAVGLYLGVCLLDALTTPTVGWDGLAPRFLSVLYKLDGTAQQVLPLDAFVIHAFGVASATWLVLACVRLARLLEVPSWPLLLLLFGSVTFRAQIGSGSVDVLLAAGIVTFVALCVSYRNGEWRAQRGAWVVLAAALIVCVFTKGTGPHPDQVALGVPGVWNDYGVPIALHWPMTALFVVFFVAGSLRRDLRGLAIAVSLYIAWLLWSSGDERHLLLALPLMASIGTAGAMRLTSTFNNSWMPPLAAAALGVFVMLSPGGLLKDALIRLNVLRSGPLSLAARLAMMPPGQPDRPAFFFPEYAEVYRYVSTLSRRTGAQHVFATSPLFRFYENGVFTGVAWPQGLSRSGDVFAGLDRDRPDVAEGWVLVATRGGHRVWLREEMQDISIPALLPDSRGQPGATDAGELMIATGPFDFDYAGLVAWQVIAAAATAPQIEAAFDTRDPQSIDATLTSVSVEKDANQPWIRYSGIVALKAGTFAEPGAVRVGIRMSGPPGQILGFKLSRRPGDGHRPPVR